MVLMNYKDIGDSLTTDEFNAIVSLLKHNKTLSDELEIKNGAVTGEYGTYTFDLESTTIVDNGILITDETLTSLGTVKLTNPVFNNATYKLHLTVISMEEPNIIDDNKSETTTTDLTITLQKDTAVQIPFETLTNYCIILFNATIEIKQDQPVITGKYVTGLTITGDKTVIQTNDTVNLTIKATDLDQIGVPNKNIKIYKNNTLWQTLTTDNNGEATYTYTGTGAGNIRFQAKYGRTRSEECTIQDWMVYDTSTHSVTGTSTNDTTYSIGWEDLSVDLSTIDFVLEWDMTATSKGVQFNLGAKDEWSTSPVKGNYRAYIGSTGGGAMSYGIRDTSTNGNSTGTFPLNTSVHCKIVKTGHTLSYYIDDTLLGTKTENWFGNYTDWSFYLVQWNTGTTTIQNINLRKG